MTKKLSKSIAFNNGDVVTSYSYRKGSSNCTNFVYFNADGSIKREEELSEKAFVSATGVTQFSMLGTKDGSGLYIFNTNVTKKSENIFFRVNNLGEKTPLSLGINTFGIPTEDSNQIIVVKLYGYVNFEVKTNLL